MIIGRKVILREKRLADAWDDYAWEKDPELAQLDACLAIGISYAEYLSYYANELRSSSTTNREFAVETLDGKHIGNCSYYNVNKTKGEAELGIMIGNRDYWDKGYGTDSITTLVNHIFQETTLNRIYLKTLESNIRAQKCFQKCGFNECGQLSRDGFSFMLMEIHRKEWESKTEQ